MGPTWVLSAPDGPHDGLMNLAIRDVIESIESTRKSGYSHNNAQLHALTHWGPMTPYSVWDIGQHWFTLTCASDNQKLAIKWPFSPTPWLHHTQSTLKMVRYNEWHIYNFRDCRNARILTIDKAPSAGRHSSWNLETFVRRHWHRTYSILTN